MKLSLAKIRKIGSFKSKIHQMNLLTLVF